MQPHVSNKSAGFFKEETGTLVTIHNKMTGFKCIDESGFPVLCDPFGNNVAIKCPGCGGPVLAILREYQRGANKESPSICPSCRSRIWVESKEDQELLVLHRVLE